MSKSIDLICVNNVIMGTHDKQDIYKFATFMAALADCDFDQLGLRGNGAVRYVGGDYICVFSGGNVLRRNSPSSTRLLREFGCPGGCGKKTLSASPKAAFCAEHSAEFLDLKESA